MAKFAFREVLNYDDHCTVVVVIIGPPISIFTERFHVFNLPRLERDLDYNASVILYVAGSCMAAALVGGPIPCALLKFTKPNGVTVPPLFLASDRGPASVPPLFLASHRSPASVPPRYRLYF